MSLHFSALRGANRARLPQFKDARGRKAHKHADGHDWTPAQWLQALIGELGELCAVRAAFELGAMPYDQFRVAVAKECADVVTYLDIASQRVLDPIVPGIGPDAAPSLMQLVAVIGSAANERKKFDRGDYSPALYFEALSKLPPLGPLLQDFLDGLAVDVRGTKQIVVMPDPDGVDLGAAVVDKFNEVSERVGSTVRLT